MIYYALLALIKARMFCMHYGLAQDHKSGMHILNGNSEKLQHNRILLNCCPWCLNQDATLKLFAMITWTIWFRRNKASFSPPGFPHDQVLQRAIDALQEFWTAQPPVQPQATRLRVKWTAPQDSIYKINFDGACLPRWTELG